MKNRYAGTVKRLLDIGLSILLLTMAFPILLSAALLVRIALGRPVLFKQKRPGLKGVPFDLIKFRTLTDARDGSGIFLPDIERMTPIGNIFRSLSLDELPELINVLKGEMSLIGPRPLLMEYLPLYTSEQRRRHEMRPGITGWAQVNGRNILPWEERFALDVWYVDHISFRLDVNIIILTIRKTLLREGIRQPGRATMEPFRGTNLKGGR